MRPALDLGCGAPGLRPAAFAGHQTAAAQPTLPARTFGASAPGGRLRTPVIASSLGGDRRLAQFQQERGMTGVRFAPAR